MTLHHLISKFGCGFTVRAHGVSYIMIGDRLGPDKLTRFRSGVHITGNSVSVNLLLGLCNL